MKKLLLFLTIAVLLYPNRSWSGTGTYRVVVDEPDELYLKVNIELWHPNPDEWKPLFTAASKALFDATEKQVKIAKVTFYKDCLQATNDSDIRIFLGDLDANTTPGSLGESARSIILSAKHKTINTSGFRGEFGLVHELGHYVFALLEEYKDKSSKIIPSATCVKLTTPLDKTTSIMDGGSTTPGRNERTEFCTASTHNTGMTEQDTKRGFGSQVLENKDDWTWIEKWMLFKHKATLKPPAAPVADQRDFGADPDFEVKECGPQVGLRAAVGIDRSGSMSASPAIRRDDMNGFEAALQAQNAPIKAAKAGADTFLRLLRAEDSAGLVQVGETIDRIPIRMMSTDNKFKSLAAISPIRAGGKAGWTELLDESFKQVTDEAADPQSFTKEVIVLLSDGRSGPAAGGADELLSSLKRRGVVTYAIGVDNEGAAGLRQAVSETGGNYLFARTAAQMNAAAMTLSAQVQSRGIIDAREGRIEAGKTQAFRVFVDPATAKTEAYFLLTWNGPKAGLAMRLTDPDGAVTDGSTDPDVNEAESEGGMKSTWIKNPRSGEWEITLTNPGTLARDFAFQIHSLARNVTVAAHAEQGAVTYPEPLVLKAAVTTDHLVSGVKVTAEVEEPDGRRSRLPLFDNGAFENRDERAGDGLYSNVFPYKANGTYNIDVFFDSEGGFTVSPEEEEKPSASSPVERFKRQARFSVVVQGAPG